MRSHIPLLTTPKNISGTSSVCDAALHAGSQACNAISRGAISVLALSAVFMTAGAGVSSAADSYYLMGMGRNYYGQLGIASTATEDEYVATPEQIASGVSAAAAGYANSLYLTSDGDLYAMGFNYYGQLGDGTTTTQKTPVKITSGVAAISIGGGFSLYLTTSGDLYGMGNNNWGQLGVDLGEDENGEEIYYTSTPVKIASDVASMSAGQYHTLYITTSGDLYAMGYNRFIYPMTIPASSTYGSDANDKLGTTGAYGYDLGTDSNGSVINHTSTPVKVATGVASCAAGCGSSYYITTDGVLYASGYNQYGQLGVKLGEIDGANTKSKLDDYFYNSSTFIQVATGVASVSAGYYHMMYVTTSGKLYATGYNNYGQLGTSVGMDPYTDKKSGVQTNAKTGVKTCDDIPYNSYTPVLVASGVAQVTCGRYFSLYVTTGSDLYGMGYNNYGQLGIDLGTEISALDTSDDPTAIAITDTLNFQHNLGPQKIASNVASASAGFAYSLYVSETAASTTTDHVTVASSYAPITTAGGKWDEVMGWIDDTYYPWVWSYKYNNWYYVYAGLGASPDTDGYWIGYYTSDCSDYGWGYVYAPETWEGWCCITSDQNVYWLDSDSDDSLPESE
jgi:alpha-tubulin suppressor-like RCC1 family protein